MKNVIKLGLAVLLFLCLLDMPYIYYELVRFLAMAGFGILAYQAHQQGNQAQMLLYGGLAILFQPLFKIALGREIWNTLDVLVAIGLLLSTFLSPRKSNS